MIPALRTGIALFLLALLTPLAALFGLPWTWITGSANRLYAAASWIAGVGLWLAGVRVQIEGGERLDPGQNYIFMCNHVSNLDPPILIGAIPGCSSVLVKSELFRVPILGSAMRIGDMVPPFKKGPFYLATDYGFPIVAVTISGSERLMPKGSIIYLWRDGSPEFSPAALVFAVQGQARIDCCSASPDSLGATGRFARSEYEFRDVTFPARIDLQARPPLAGYHHVC